MSSLSCVQNLFLPTDPIFADEGIEDGTKVIPGMGTLEIDAKKANAWAVQAFERLGIEGEQLHGAQLFHGATSSSLLAFTEYGNREGRLLPSGVLQGMGRVHFHGACDRGLQGVNRDCLSTVWIGEYQEVFHYMHAGSYAPSEILARRECEKVKLSAKELGLVQEAFPVLYGIYPSREGCVQSVASAVDGEVGLLGGTDAREIRVIFTSQVECVKQVVAGHEIAVYPLTDQMQEHLEQASR